MLIGTRSRGRQRVHGTSTHFFFVANLTFWQAFEPNPLSPSITWDNVGDNVSSMIFGRGQTVFWKGSNVTVYEKNSDGTDQITQLKGWPDGQGLISPGTKLYVTNGKVQEG